MHFFESVNFGSVPFGQLSLTVWLLIWLALAFDFLNGFHDAANSVATIVSTRVLSPYAAVVWAAFFNFVAFLVFGLHVAETIGRMIEFFPEGKQQQIRSVMAGVLKGVVSQRLLPRVDGGRVAAVEVMVMNSRISDLIREDKTESIPEAIEDGEFFDMQTFTKALIDHVLAGRVDRQVAANASTNNHDFLVSLEQAIKRQSHEQTVAAQEEEQRQREEEGPTLPELRLA